MDLRGPPIPETHAPITRVRKQHRRILEKLGPAPGLTLRTMADYGLDDGEIARYFKMTPSSVRRVRLVLSGDDSST